MSAAKQLHTELFMENWTQSSKTPTEESIISYLIVEEIKPPDHIWGKICSELDKPLKSNVMTSTFKLSRAAIVSLLVSGAVLTVSVFLYFLV